MKGVKTKKVGKSRVLPNLLHNSKNLSSVNSKYLSKETADHVEKEVLKGLEMLNDVDNPIVSVFGSHFGQEGEKDYDSARKTANSLGKEGYAIVTGGGPGIMRAANQGAKEAGVPSIGVIAALIQGEKKSTKFFTHEVSLKYVFVRRFILSIKSEAMIFYPGGFGTLNELFEFLVLIQTGITDKVPVILVDKKYWQGLFNWLKTLNGKYISQKDLALISFAENTKEILKIINDNKKEN